MPSPIPRSSSLSQISKPKSSFPSNCSTSSPCYLSRCPKFQSKQRKNAANYDLTKDSLSEHNRLQQAAAVKKINKASPYYKGLTDSELYLKSLRCGGGISPSRESHTTRVSKTSTLSTIFVKFQGIGLCFKGKRELIDDEADIPKALPPPPPPPGMPSPVAMNSRVSVSLEQNEIGSFTVLKENIPSRKEAGAVERKPLRERYLMVPLAEDCSAIDQEMQKESSIVEKFTWAKKYRPKRLKDFICDRDKAEFLLNLVSNGEFGNLIFEGPPGVGKRTMMLALLREAFGPERLETREELKEFQLKGEAVASIKVNVKVSSKHIEVNLSELHGHEKHVIVALLEESNDAAANCDHTKCRVIVLYQAERLSTDAQHYNRWIMERYKGCNKIIFCCSDISKLQPMKPICMHIQLLPPSKDKIVEVLKFIAEEESIELSHHLAERIAQNSKQNLRQAIRSLEASWQSNFPFKDDQVILTGWEEDIANIAKNIIDEQSPKQLYIIRGKLLKLFEHNVSPDFIFGILVGELKKHLNDHFHSKLDSFHLDYKRDNGLLVDGEESLVPRNRKELGKRNDDPTRKNVHNFMKIEGNGIIDLDVQNHVRSVPLGIRYGSSVSGELSACHPDWSILKGVFYRLPVNKTNACKFMELKVL